MSSQGEEQAHGFQESVGMLIYKRLDAQDVTLDRIEKALVGDTLGNKGLVHRVNVVEDRVERHDRKLWLAGIACVLAQALVVLAVELWIANRK